MHNLKQTSGRYKTQYGKHTRPKKLIVGDQVLLLQPNKQNILQTQWEGPYPIAEKVYENNYKLKIKGKLKVYHGKNPFLEGTSRNGKIGNDTTECLAIFFTNCHSPEKGSEFKNMSGL